MPILSSNLDGFFLVFLSMQKQYQYNRDFLNVYKSASIRHCALPIQTLLLSKYEKQTRAADFKTRHLYQLLRFLDTIFFKGRPLKMTHVCDFETPTFPLQSLVYITSAFVTWSFVFGLCLTCCSKWIGKTAQCSGQIHKKSVLIVPREGTRTVFSYYYQI